MCASVLELNYRRADPVAHLLLLSAPWHRPSGATKQKANQHFLKPFPWASEGEIKSGVRFFAHFAAICNSEHKTGTESTTKKDWEDRGTNKCNTMR